MKKTSVKILALTCIVILIFSSCSAKSSLNDFVGNSGKNEDFIKAPQENESMDDAGSNKIDYNTSTTSNTDRKIIETIDYTVQTKEFDKLLDRIEESISALGGYIESSNIYGREFDSNRNRSAYIKIRIPAENSSSFKGFVLENSVVVNESVNTKDITLTYVDMESRTAALEAEKESLERLLKDAENMTDIINIRDKLTDVIYEIESHKAQLRTYDNLVDYSTISINIHEVERTTVVTEQTTWQKIGTNLKNNFENVWNGAVAVFIFAVSSIPYLIPVAVIAIAAITIIMICKKRARKKTSDATESEEN